MRGLNQSIQNKVGAWLLVRGRTKQELASELGFTVQTLNNRLDGSREWSWKEIIQLARILGCSIEELA